MSHTLRVLVVDDTAIYRKIVSDVLGEIPGIEVVGTAVDGRIALDKIRELKPDLITLDLEMPQLSGVEVLKQLRLLHSSVGAIMLSAFTSAGAAATTEALRLGAFDFVLKPTGTSPTHSADKLKSQLAERLQAFAASRGQTLSVDGPTQRVEAPLARTAPISRVVASTLGQAARPQIIVLGISTGGPEALTKLLPKLPADLAAPLFIVQHMPPMFTKSLADDLNHRSALNVCEAVEGQIAQPGDVLIAPGGKQMKIERSELGPVARITDDPPENSCRPAVDYLFRSAAHHYGDAVLGIIMTGMGSDGTLGCRLLKRRGAAVLAQNKETCVVFGMPAIPVEEGLADAVVPLQEMASAILERVGQGVRA
ncbi:MAG TPA: chemotaxis response regulator protein-glutamate methylesterase [Pirellulaceae bacterium]|nr:chemotaxis response regulator protein-glutamate methylesterase [Pirellulaceae bacterium]